MLVLRSTGLSHKIGHRNILNLFFLLLNLDLYCSWTHLSQIVWLTMIENESKVVELVCNTQITMNYVVTVVSFSEYFHRGWFELWLVDLRERYGLYLMIQLQTRCNSTLSNVFILQVWQMDIGCWLLQLLLYIRNKLCFIGNKATLKSAKKSVFVCALCFLSTM